MLSSFWQVASVIVLATFGSAVAFSERFCDQSGQHCLASSARGLLERESVVKDYFRTRRDWERNAFDSRVSGNNDRRIRELDSRRFDTKTDRLSRVYEDRSITTERDLSRERMRSNEVDNEKSTGRSQRDRAERRMDSYDQRSVQRRERQEERRNLSNLRRDFRRTLKTVNGRNDDRQYRLSLERDNKIIDLENAQRIRDLVGSFNTRREIIRISAGRRQTDDRRQNRGIPEIRERIDERVVLNREERERHVLARGISERRARQDRSEYNFRRLETRPLNSNDRFDINRNVLDASIPLNSNRNNNRRTQRDLREMRDINREEIRVQDREIRRTNLKSEDTKRDGQIVNERRQTRDTIESHGPITLRNERDEYRKVRDRNLRNERTAEERIQDGRIEREIVRNAQDTRSERRLEREDERRVRDISAGYENERRVQEAIVVRRDDRNARLERRIRDSSTERNERLERRVQEFRAEGRDTRNTRLERKDSTDERREARSIRLVRGTDPEIRVERHASRNARLERKSEQRRQEARAEGRIAMNTRIERENERVSRNIRFERENERRVQEAIVERRDTRNAQLHRDSRVERRESRNMRLERGDERKVRDSSDERGQDHRIERLDTNGRFDDIIRSSNRQFETRRKLLLSSYPPQGDSLKNTAYLNVQMVQALLIGMLLLKVVTQQDVFTKKMNFMADSCKNVVSVGARKLF